MLHYLLHKRDNPVYIRHAPLSYSDLGFMNDTTNLDEKPPLAAGAVTEPQVAPSERDYRSRGSSITIQRKNVKLNPFYGYFVSLLKLILPTMALAMIIGVAIWPLIEDGNGYNSFLSDPDIDSTKLQVFDATYGGYGNEGAPYTITADRAIQPDPDQPIIDLEGPKGDILWNNEIWYAITAPEGRMFQDTGMLELWGGVNAFQDQGFEFRSERFSLDLKNRSAFTDAPVEGQGPDIYMTSEGIHVHDQGTQIDLLGKSKIIFSGAKPDKKS